MVQGAILKWAGVASLAALVAACVVDTHDPPHQMGVSGTGGYPNAGGSSSNSGAPSAYPILVDVDTNQTIDADPGKGVGVFTEYVAGGHWHIWWTCDTAINANNSVCPFDVKATVATGSITHERADQPGATLSRPSQQAVESITSTSTGIDGMTFDTDPGAVITLSASVGGAYDPGILFFVAKGSINGGYGAITDPLMLEGSSP